MATSLKEDQNTQDLSKLKHPKRTFWLKSASYYFCYSLLNFKIKTKVMNTNVIIIQKKQTQVSE